MQRFHFIVLNCFLLLILIQSDFVNGISCYVCQSDSASSLCISRGGSPSKCDKKYCTIYRQEYLDPAGKIQKFYRACEDEPLYLNAIVHTKEEKLYYRACAENLCNVGDGLDDFVIKKVNSSSSTIIVVPGIGINGGIMTTRIDNSIAALFAALYLLVA